MTDDQIQSLVQRGQFAAAEQALRQRLAVAPGDARYWHALAVVLRGLSRPVQAEAAAAQALSLHGAAEHWSGLGDCLFDQRRWTDAANAYRQALERQPADVRSWTNLGAAEQAEGRIDSALHAYERALALDPGDANAATRYAFLHVQRGDVPRGIELAQRVVAQSPELAAAWLVLGVAHRLADELPQAEAAFRRIIALAPQNAESRHHLALVLLQQMRSIEAEELLRSLVADNPASAPDWLALGGALLCQARAEEAIAALRRAVELDPHPTSHGRLLQALHYDVAVGPADLLVEHRRWNAAYAEPLAPPAPPVVPKGRQTLRIGLVAVDFSAGPLAFLGLPALEALDRTACSLACYSDRLSGDEYTDRFRAIADVWRPTLHLSDEDLARQIRADEIDVLIDLGGHVGRRLLAFARRPALLQLTWLGYVGTTGCTAIDVLLADRFHVRPGEEAFYAEQVVRLPDDYVCYGPPPGAPDVTPPPALTAGHITFGCFNNPAKYSSSALAAWAEILRRVPTAHMLLKYGGLEQPELQRRILARFAACGVDSTRIRFSGRSPPEHMMVAYSLVDIALDTQPYSGGLTTCEALWMGVPVITVPGPTFASRHSTSHLNNAGYAAWIAADWPGYIELAARWADQAGELARLRDEMRDKVRHSPLCDAPRFASGLLAALRSQLAR